MSDEEAPRNEIAGDEAEPKDIGSSASPPKEVQRALQKLTQNKSEGIFEMMTVAAGMGNPPSQQDGAATSPRFWSWP